MRMILTRLIPPVTLARLILLAVLTRLVMPLLEGVTDVPASSTSTSSTAVASIIALGAMLEAPVADGPKLLTVFGVVAMYIVEDAERSIALG